MSSRNRGERAIGSALITATTEGSVDPPGSTSVDLRLVPTRIIER